AGHLERRAEATERDPVQHHRHEPVVLHRVLHELGRYESGRNCIHRDAVSPPLCRKLANELVQPGFACTVRGETAPAAGDAASGREVNDAAAVAGFNHRLAGSLREPECTAQVDLDHLTPCLLIEFLRFRLEIYAGQVDEDFEATELLDNE